MNSIVGDYRSTFIKDRVIFDNSVLSHELIKGYERKNISPRCMLKINLQKAYDSVEWPFIKYLMLEMGFPFKFVKWIMACITPISYTYNVNGDMTELMKKRRGCDRKILYLLIFCLCIEYLNRCLLELRSCKEFQCHPRCKRLSITHICFVDDLLLFSRGDLKLVKHLCAPFSKFSVVSGLQANLGKSSLYFARVKENIQKAIL